VFEAATLIQTGKIHEFPLVLMGRELWRPLTDFFRERLIAEDTIAEADARRIRVTDSPAEAVAAITDVAMRRFGLT